MTSLADAAAEILARSGMTKSALCAKAKVSRTSLDAYLKGTTQPTIAQIERLAAAAGLVPQISFVERPKPVSEQFLAVLEFGDLFPREPKGPLVNLGPVWRAAREHTREE
ncbi:helix-turn-helix domain-containing protein [Aeromicrobium sp. Sec7.5]|uniref:helix-turn-helix domain-containing protein n=1 Tax=Aeromicrobium sp. Sec7.5 TaxID=3121276 RepID=UPI002FE4DEFC